MGELTLLQTIFYVIYLLLVVGTILVVLTDNRNPFKTLAWVVVLIFIPLAGLIGYYIFGQDLRKQRLVNKRYYNKIKNLSFQELEEEDAAQVRPEYEPLVALLKTNNNSPLLYGSQVEVIRTGDRMFAALLADMEAATDHIHIEFFIFNNDQTGQLVKEMLIRKAREGVTVRFIFDRIANWLVPIKYYREMKEAGVQIATLMEVRYPLLQSSKINYRNHRKVVVIDGKAGYIGGMNVSDNYLFNPNWWDRHLRMEGHGVHGLQASFLQDWTAAGRPWKNSKKYFPAVKPYTHNLMQIVTIGPFTDYSNLLQAIIRIILTAKRYIYLQTPYFLPTDSLFEALQIAALSGIDVRLMVSKKSDSAYVDPAAHSYYEGLLKVGMRIYEMQDKIMHAKTIVVDDYISVIGSCNLDYRSFETNFEINCYMYDSPLAIQNRELFLEDMKYCKAVHYKKWVKRSRWRKLIESIMRLFSPLL